MFSFTSFLQVINTPRNLLTRMIHICFSTRSFSSEKNRWGLPVFWLIFSTKKREGFIPFAPRGHFSNENKRWKAENEFSNNKTHEHLGRDTRLTKSRKVLLEEIKFALFTHILLGKYLGKSRYLSPRKLSRRSHFVLFLRGIDVTLWAASIPHGFGTYPYFFWPPLIFLIFAIRKSQKMSNEIFWRRPGLNLHRGRPLYKCTEAGALCKFHRGPSMGSVPAAHVTSAGAGAALLTPFPHLFSRVTHGAAAFLGTFECLGRYL